MKKEIQDNREWIPEELNPKKFPNGKWKVGPGEFCTEHALFHQRLYFKHEDGRWSRPKDHESTNSLSGF